MLPPLGSVDPGAFVSHPPAQAVAGVINIVSRAPSEEFKGFINAGYFGGGEEKRVRGSVSGALIPDLLRASVLLNYAEYDGNVKNVYNGETVNGYRHAGFAGTAHHRF